MMLSPSHKSRRSLERRVSELSNEGEWEIRIEDMFMQDKIGQGAFGCVHLATWRGTEVAIKILEGNDGDLQQFYTEITVMTRLHHPNILQVLGCSTKQGQWMLVFENMCNGSLLPHVRSRRDVLTHMQKIIILKDIAKGLAYLHNRQPFAVIHRDLKPSNILLTNSMNAKIADFGISSIRPIVDEYYQMTGETGSYRYMAPEVLKSEKYNCKVDVWSFGMILYALFVDEPFTWSTDKFSFFAELSSAYPLKNFRFDSSMPSDIKQIFMKTTCTDPRDRWDSMYLVQNCNSDLKVTDVKKSSGWKRYLSCISPNFD